MSETVEPTTSKIRWLLLLVILLVTGSAFVFLEGMEHSSVQEKWLRRVGVGSVGLLLIVVWYFFLSRLSARLRLRTVWGLLALGIVVISQVKYVGVSGDLVPLFQWRWAEASAPPPLQGATADTTELDLPPGGADFPQFLGPNRNGKLAGPKLERDWKKHPPKELWRRAVGKAWSGFAVVGNRAVTQEQRDDQEMVVCYHLQSGEILWSHADAARYENNLAGIGPRATPTIHKGRVYTQGATGILNCLELNTGRRVWTRNIIESHGAKVPTWGVSASPLVLEGEVIVVPGHPSGATLAAYHPADGTRLWMGGNQEASYASPIMATFEGMEQILYFGPKALVGFDRASGKVLWDYPWHPENPHPHVSVPVLIKGHSVLISSGYGKGSSLAHISRSLNGAWTADETWTTNRMKAKFSNLIEHQGIIYGLDDGMFAAQDPKLDGTLLWRDGRFGHGQTLLVGGLFLIMAENGDLVLVEPSTLGLKEITRVTLLHDKTWNLPALAGRYLLIRNDQEAACFEMPVIP